MVFIVLLHKYQTHSLKSFLENERRGVEEGAGIQEEVNEKPNPLRLVNLRVLLLFFKC